MHKLQECRSLTEAEPFLRGKGPALRKIVETAILLQNHPNPQQQQIGNQFMATAIQELDAAEEPTPKESPGLKTKGDHFVKEEELAGGNKSGTAGSEQSSDNTEPYPQVADSSEDGQKDMEKMDDTENQFSEMGGMPGGMPGMMPPGLDPQIAQQMAPNMPQLPQMNTPQQVQQMQYTVKKYMEAYMKPVREQVIRLTKANAFLSKQVKEMQTSSVGLDINKFSKENKGPLRETSISIPKYVTNQDQSQGGPKVFEKLYSLEKERQSISDIDKMISSSGNQPYA